MNRFLVLLSCFSACSLHANSPCFDDVKTSVELLWWNATGDELTYAVLREGTHVESTNEVFDDLKSQSYIAIPQWSPGFRLHVDKPISCPEISVFGEYTWYQTNDSQSTHLTAPTNSQSYLQMTSDFLFGQEVLSFGRILDGKLESYFFFDMYRLDFGFEKYYSFCDQGRVKPFVSATFLHTDEDLTVKANTTLPQSIVVNQKNRVDTKYDGFGGQLGLWADWRFNHCFSAYAGASITGLYGRYKGNNHFSYQSNQFGSSTLKDRFQLDYWTGRIVSDLKFGISYQVCLCNRYDMKMHIGWELQTLFDQTNWANKAGLAGRSSNQSSANLNLQGFVIGADFGF